MRGLTFIAIIFIFIACGQVSENPFWHGGEEQLDIQRVFEGERFPTVVVATDGSVVATWGSNTYQVRRSEDGGETWGEVIGVTDISGRYDYHGGGVTVDENRGTIFAFIDRTLFLEDGDPEKLSGPGGRSGTTFVFKSTDHGKTWSEFPVVIHPDKHGNMPAMHMNERGITLQRGPHAGRLIRPARFFKDYLDQSTWGEDYTNAIYSDDGGETWYTSDPFPALGTGEATLEELSDGRIYYNSRRHVSTDGLNPRMRYIAWSYDGGHTWTDLSVSEELPDGPQGHDYGLMGGLVRLPVDGYDILLFSNVDSPGDRWDRRRGMVWASFDGGLTWPVSRLVDEGGFAYSSMTAGRKGTPSEGWIYLMYEKIENGQYVGANVARFNLDWVTQGRDWKVFY